MLLPVSKPIIATITLFSAVAQWNSYRDTLYYVVDNKKLYTLQYLVQEIIKKAEGNKMLDRSEMMEIFHGNASTADPVSLRMAITIVTVLPSAAEEASAPPTLRTKLPLSQSSLESL